MKHIYIIIFLSVLSFQLNAQEKVSFSLNEAIENSLKNNFNIKKAQNNVLKAQKKVWETTAMGLPQINADVSYQKFIEQPVQMVPATLANPSAPPDLYVPIRFGTEQNMKWAATLKQLIFSGSYLVGLQSSKTFKKISEYALQKTRQKIKEATVNAYGNALMTDESIKIMQKNIKTVKQNLFEVEQMYKNGLVEETDLEQLLITFSNLENQLDYLKRVKKTAYQMLNYIMGRPVDTPIQLSDNIETLKEEYMQLNILQEPFSPEQNIDYIITKNHEKAKKLQVKYQKTQALPTIAAFINYGKNAYDNEFNFFNETKSWYEQSILGISIQIPLFSTGMRAAKLQQAKIDLENAKNDVNEKAKELLMQYRKLKNEYEHSFKNYEIAKQNLRLSEKIERKEQIKFIEGVGNSFQLNQARMQLYQSQQDYLKSIINIINKKVALENILSK